MNNKRYIIKKITFIFFLLITVFAQAQLNYYWKGGSGKWGDVNKWAIGSATGPTATVLPTQNDNVFFTVSTAMGLREDLVQYGFYRYYDPSTNSFKVSNSSTCKNLTVAPGVRVRFHRYYNYVYNHYYYNYDYNRIEVYGNIEVASGAAVFASYYAKPSDYHYHSYYNVLSGYEFLDLNERRVYEGKFNTLELVGSASSTIKSLGVLDGFYSINKTPSAEVTFLRETKTGGAWQVLGTNQKVTIETGCEIGGIYAMSGAGTSISSITITPGATVNIATLYLGRGTSLDAKNITLNVSNFHAQGIKEQPHDPSFITTVAPNPAQTIDISNSTINVGILKTGVFASRQTSRAHALNTVANEFPSNLRWWEQNYFYNRKHYLSSNLTELYIIRDYLWYWNNRASHLLSQYNYTTDTDLYSFLSEENHLSNNLYHSHIGHYYYYYGYDYYDYYDYYYSLYYRSENDYFTFDFLELVPWFNIQAVAKFKSTGSTIIFKKSGRIDDTDPDAPFHFSRLQASDVYNGGRVAPIVFNKVVFEDEGKIVSDYDLGWFQVGMMHRFYPYTPTISPKFQINTLEVKGGAYKKNTVYVQGNMDKEHRRRLGYIWYDNNNLQGEVTINNAITGTAGVSCYPLMSRLKNVEKSRITVKTTGATAINHMRLHGVTGANNTANNSADDGSNTAITFNQPANLLKYEFPTVTLAGGTTPPDATCYEEGTTLIATFSASMGTPPYTFTYKLNDALQTPVVTAAGQSTVQKIFTIPQDLNYVNANLSTFKISEVTVTDANGITCNYLQPKWHYSLAIKHTPKITTGPDVVCNGSTESYTGTAGSGATLSVTGPATASLQANGNFTVTGTGVGDAYVTYGTGGTTSPTVECGKVTKRIQILDCACDVAGDKVICQGGTTQLTGYAGGAPASGTWSVVSQSPANAVSLSATTGSSITVTGNAGGTATIRYSGGSGASACTKEVTVTVQAPLNITGTLPAATCKLEPQTVSLAGLPATGFYNITANDGTTTANIVKSNLTGATYDFEGLEQGKTYTFTVTTEYGCTGTTVVATPAQLAVPAPTIQSVTQPTCATPTGTVTFENLPSSYTITAKSGSTSIVRTGSTATYAFTNLPQGKTYTFIVKGANNCESSPIKVSIDAPSNIRITQPLQNQLYCVGDTPVALSVTHTDLPTGATNTLSYQWYKNDAIITGATSATYTPNISVAGTNEYYVIITDSCGPTTITSNKAKVEVKDLVIKAQPIGAVYCPTNIKPLTVKINNTARGTPTYQWYSNTTNSTTGGTLITGATSNSYTPPNTLGETYYYVQIKDECKVVTSTPALVKILPSCSCNIAGPTTLSTTNTNSCGTTNNTATLTASYPNFDQTKAGASTITWASSDPSIATVTTPGTVGTTGAMATVTAAAGATNGSTVIITYTEAQGGTTTTCTTEITIADPQCCTVTPTDSSVCPEGNTNVVATYPSYDQATTSASTITWTSSDPNVTVTSPGTVGTANVSATVNVGAGATPGSMVTITYTEVQGGTSTSVITCTSEITIAEPSVGGRLNNITYCSGATTGTTLTLTGHTGTVTGWERSASADFSTTITPITNTASTLDVNSLSLLAETYYFRAKVKSGTCAEVTSAVGKAVVVATPPAPTVGTITNPTCTSATGRVELSNLPATGSYTIVATPTSGTGTITKSGSGANFIFTDLVASTTYTFVVTTAIGSCSSPSSTQASIGVAPVVPVISGTTTICEDATTVLTANVAGGYWSSSTPGIAEITSGGVVTGKSQGVTRIKYTTVSGCDAYVYVTVQKKANAGTNGTLSLCSGGTPTNAQLFAQLGGNPDTGGTWTNVGNVYTYTVSAVSPCTEAVAQVTVTSATPTAPVRNTITQPTCTLATGSVSLSGLPSGTYSVTATPTTGSAITRTGLTGTTYNFTGLEAGKTYTFTVTNADGCTSPASTNAILETQPSPPTTTYQLTTNDVCSGTNATLTLSGSESGVSYQLQAVVSPVTDIGTNVAGTGNAITFTAPSVTTETTYQVVAIQGTCRVTLPSLASVGIIPIPSSIALNDENLKICKEPARDINLNSYMPPYTTHPGSSGYTVQWSKDGTPLTDPTGNAFNTGSLSDGNVTKYEYTLTETICGQPVTKTAHLYIKALKGENLSFQDVDYDCCESDAVSLNLNQILGQPATGTWQAVTATGAPSAAVGGYLTGNTFAGAAALRDGVSIVGGEGVYYFKFEATQPTNCMPIGTTATVKIVIEPD